MALSLASSQRGRWSWRVCPRRTRASTAVSTQSMGGHLWAGWLWQVTTRSSEGNDWRILQTSSLILVISIKAGPVPTKRPPVVIMSLPRLVCTVLMVVLFSTTFLLCVYVHCKWIKGRRASLSRPSEKIANWLLSHTRSQWQHWNHFHDMDVGVNSWSGSHSSTIDNHVIEKQLEVQTDKWMNIWINPWFWFLHRPEEWQDRHVLKKEKTAPVPWLF